MNFSELKNKDFFWLIVAFFTGAFLWSGPSFLQNIGPDHGKLILIVSLVLFSFGAIVGYYKKPKPWKMALASILSLPFIEIISFALAPKDIAASISISHSLPYFIFKTPVYLLQSLPVLIGCYVGDYNNPRDKKHDKHVIWYKQNWNLMLGFAPGFVSGIIYNMTTPKTQAATPFPVILVTAMILILIVSSFIISYLLPQKVWRWAMAVGLGLVAAVITRIFIDLIQGSVSHNLFPFEIILSVIISFPLTFTGAYLGLLANSLVKKIKNK